MLSIFAVIIYNRVYDATLVIRKLVIEVKFMKIIFKLGDILEKISRIILMILVAILGISIFLQVFFRYFLNNPLSWSEEVARYCMIWITFIGASVAFNDDSMSSVDLLVNAVPRTARKLMILISNLSVFIITLFVFKYSIDLLLLPGTLYQTSAGIGMPMWIVYLCGPVGLFSMSIQIFIRLIKIVLNWNKEVLSE